MGKVTSRQIQGFTQFTKLDLLFRTLLERRVFATYRNAPPSTPFTVVKLDDLDLAYIPPVTRPSVIAAHPDPGEGDGEDETETQDAAIILEQE
jgi:hypothetical protein